MTLDQVERLADLHIRRKRIRELEDSAWNLISTGTGGLGLSRGVTNEVVLRGKAKLYRDAGRMLFLEIKTLEDAMSEAS